MKTRLAAIAIGIGIVALAIWLWRGVRDRVRAQERDADRVADAPRPVPVPWLARGARPGTDRAAGTRPEAVGDAGVPEDGDGGVSRRWSLRVFTVDGATGTPVAARWHWRGPQGPVAFPPGQVLDEATLSANRAWADDRAKAYEAEFLPSGERAAGELFEDPDTPLRLYIRTPRGYVVLDDQTLLTNRFAADVSEVWAVVPLHREAVLDVRVIAPDGTLAEGVSLQAAIAAGGRLWTPAETLAPGELRIRGIPHLAGEPVSLGLEWEPTAVKGEDVVREPEEGIESPEVSTTIPTDLAARWTVLVRLKGPVSHLMDHNETDNDMPTEESFSVVAEEGAPRGSLRVKALGWEGRPATDAVVFGTRVDAEGVGFFDHLVVGEVAVWATSPGRFPAAQTVRVRAGETTEVVLREPVGARLEVVVVDEDGRPRPFAAIRVDRTTFDVGEGGQRIDPFTDANGRRSFARVEAGEAKVFARWGTRYGSATVTLRDGERATVRIVAK